ncbi:LysR substrate-binding domain-containing protein [Aliiroseovarius sp. F47248L]|uniref:LysR substrate-binding domain-containing protein n=1 Tax=Aliiroseovarius sp. F47248L TaxID=2926420 RepID=UPI001FF24489|nr:LysR substrate-binding domain-containing protein [Aliiroseovarius sp. F47248L]
MSHPLRLRQLEALMAVTHHGSMTRGAQELGISQPAVSRLLSDLREVLGFDLFNRRDGRLVPTQEVRFLLPDIRRVLETMHQISEASQNITDKKAGHLRIACLPGFATSHLPGIVAAFLRDRPGVSVTLEPDRPERILEWMVGEQYDFGITDGFEGHPAVESEHIDICTVCVFPEGHRLASLKTIGAQDLANENLIHTRRDSAFFRDLNEAFQKANTTINSLVESRQFTAACEMVCQGIGVSVVSAVDAAKYVGQGLDHRPFTPSIPHRLSLVRPTLKQPSMISLEFMEVFSASLTPYKLR